MENLICVSWLHGKHSEKIEINTKLPYVSIDNFFCQGDEAEKIINEINEIYNDEKLNLNVLEAVKYWANLYL